MEYLSTRNDKISEKFEHIFIKGLSDEGGLFLPKQIKKLSDQISSNHLVSLEGERLSKAFNAPKTKELIINLKRK